VIESALLAGAGLVHRFGDRRGGVSTGVYAHANVGFHGDDPAAVRENRRRFAEALGARVDALCTVKQVHGAAAHAVNGPDRQPVPADAVVSATPGLVLGVATADCVPVLLADVDAGVAAAVHAGWRGAVAGVVEAALEAMAASGAERARVRAALGPAIRQAGYEVDRPVFAAATAAMAEAERFFRPAARPERWDFDLPGYVAARLARAGVGLIDDVGVDTLKNDAIYFSHRRSRQREEAGYGVQMSGIVVPAMRRGGVAPVASGRSSARPRQRQ